jgi:Caspase domain
MNKKDYALVIGVARYQDKVRFASLDGPSVDCTEFVDHLVHDGQVPKANIESVVWAPSVTHAFPTRSDVELALQSLMFSPKGNLPRKGRRLYLFTAGHCEAPGETEINVLTAESGKIGPVSYPLSKVALAIHYSGLFKEIVLFTDGCRTAGDSCPPPVLDGLPRGSSSEIAKVRRLHAYACSLGLPAYEDEIDGKIRGLFSYALIEGLNGKAKNKDGHIDDLSLEEYVRVRVGQLGGSALGQEPEVYCPKSFRLL